MDIRLNFKTPDVVFYALQDIPEEYQEQAQEKISKYVKYGECVSIQVNIETGEAEVVRV